MTSGFLARRTRVHAWGPRVVQQSGHSYPPRMNPEWNPQSESWSVVRRPPQSAPGVESAAAWRAGRRSDRQWRRRWAGGAKAS